MVSDVKSIIIRDRDRSWRWIVFDEDTKLDWGAVPSKAQAEEAAELAMRRIYASRLAIFEKHILQPARQR